MRFLKQKQNPKVIVCFGSIGAGKTTFLRMLKEYFEKKGLTVYLPKEVSLRIKRIWIIFIPILKDTRLCFKIS
jgi:signal recognition particle GTPase